MEFIVEAAKKKGFKELEKVKKLKAGDKIIFTNMGKLAALAVIGRDPIEKGMKVVASHIDTPRIDLKQKPLYEDPDSELALLKTHYYGGIKKYQWANIPLALHGVIIRADGKTIKMGFQFKYDNHTLEVLFNNLSRFIGFSEEHIPESSVYCLVQN